MVDKTTINMLGGCLIFVFACLDFTHMIAGAVILNNNDIADGCFAIWPYSLVSIIMTGLCGFAGLSSALFACLGGTKSSEETSKKGQQNMTVRGLLLLT